MGKTIVRKYVHTTEAQSVWKDSQDQMKSSSKGASEKRKLTQYVTVLDDNYKGTTEQFVLHFNEQFRQLEEISNHSEHFPPQIKLQLLQIVVRPINDLRIVETLDEFQSIATGYGRSSSLKYQTYYAQKCLCKVCCRILGLQPLIPLLQYVNRLGFEICSVNRTRKLGYVNLNWARCTAHVTESLALTDGSFC